MDAVSYKAPAKINLSLNVVKKREDNYHEVRMVMVSIDLYDELTLSRTEGSDIVLGSDSKDIPINEDNLIYK